MSHHISHRSTIGGGHIQSNERRVRNPRSNSSDENLALFSNMHTQEHNYLHPSADDTEASLSTKIGEFMVLRNVPSSTPPWKSNDLLAIDAEKNDYDWLLTPPETPLFPSLGRESPPVHVQRNPLHQTRPTSTVSKLSRPVARELYNRSQSQRPSSSAVPCTNSRNSFTTEKKMARPTRQMSMEASNARSKHLDTLSFRSSSTEKYAPPKRRGRGVSLSPGPRALQKPEDDLMAENPHNLGITRTERPRSCSKGATLLSKPGAVVVSGALETCESKQHNSLSSGSRMSSSTTSRDYLSRKESILSPADNRRDQTVLISTRRDNKIVDQRLASAVSNQPRQSKGTSTKGLGPAPKSRERSTPSKDIDGLSKDMIGQPTPWSAPTLLFQDVRPRGTQYKTSNPFSRPTVGTTRMARSEQGEKLMSNEKSIDKGEREFEDKWEQGFSPKTASKADAETNKKHVIRHVYEGQIKGVINTSKTSSPMSTSGKDTFRNQNTCKGSNFAAITKNGQASQKNSSSSLYKQEASDQASVDIKEDLPKNQDCGFHNVHNSYLGSNMMPDASQRLIRLDQAKLQEIVKKTCTDAHLKANVSCANKQWSFHMRAAESSSPTDVRDRFSSASTDITGIGGFLSRSQIQGCCHHQPELASQSLCCEYFLEMQGSTTMKGVNSINDQKTHVKPLYLEDERTACPKSTVLEGRLNEFEAGSLAITFKKEISKRVKRVISLLKSIEATFLRKEEVTSHGTATEHQNASPLKVDDIHIKVPMVLPSKITLENANKSSTKANLICRSIQHMPIKCEGFDKLVHENHADEATTPLFLEKNPQDLMKKPQLDILEPSPMHVNSQKVGLLALRAHDHAGKTDEVVGGTQVVSLDEDAQESHRKSKVEEFITESPLRIRPEKNFSIEEAGIVYQEAIKKDKSVPNQKEDQLQNVQEDQLSGEKCP